MSIRTIKINCKHVYDSGLKYEKEAEEITNIQKKLLSAYSEIKKIWPGVDGHNFLVSFDSHITELNDLVSFLDEEAFILKGTALEHNQIDNEFVEKMKRSDIDEQNRS